MCLQPPSPTRRRTSRFWVPCGLNGFGCEPSWAVALQHEQRLDGENDPPPTWPASAVQGTTYSPFPGQEPLFFFFILSYCTPSHSSLLSFRSAHDRAVSVSGRRQPVNDSSLPPLVVC